MQKYEITFWHLCYFKLEMAFSNKQSCRLAAGYNKYLVFIYFLQCSSSVVLKIIHLLSILVYQTPDSSQLFTRSQLSWVPEQASLCLWHSDRSRKWLMKTKLSSTPRYFQFQLQNYGIRMTKNRFGILFVAIFLSVYKPIKSLNHVHKFCIQNAYFTI